MPVVIGCDPGFGHLGAAVVELSPKHALVLALHHSSTEKSDKKRSVYASDDNLRRAQELSVSLENLIAAYHPVALCVEAMSFPRNASSAQKVGIAWGVIASLARQYGLPVLQQSPQAIKLAVCGRKDASKEDVQAALHTRYSNLTALDKTAKLTKTVREHPYDALAAVVACLNSEVILLARRNVVPPIPGPEADDDI
jgi:crossover junction endodeoxyribonuclease RuvC